MEAAANLLDCFAVPEDFKAYVNDYHINLFEIAYLEPEKVKLFKSDFGIVADYFVQMRTNNDYHPAPTTMRHVEEILKLMTVMTQDYRYESAYNDSMKGGQTTMCDVLDRIENRGISKGIAAGEEKKAGDAAKNFYAMGLTIESIAKGVGYPVDTVKKWLSTAAPEANG